MSNRVTEQKAIQSQHMVHIHQLPRCASIRTGWREWQPQRELKYGHMRREGTFSQFKVATSGHTHVLPNVMAQNKSGQVCLLDEMWTY